MTMKKKTKATKTKINRVTIKQKVKQKKRPKMTQMRLWRKKTLKQIQNTSGNSRTWWLGSISRWKNYDEDDRRWKRRTKCLRNFRQATVMTHHSKAVVLFLCRVEWGGMGGSVFYFGPHNKSYKSVEPSRPPAICCHQRLFPQNTPAGSV